MFSTPPDPAKTILLQPFPVRKPAALNIRSSSGAAATRIGAGSLNARRGALALSSEKLWPRASQGPLKPLDSLSQSHLDAPGLQLKGFLPSRAV